MIRASILDIQVPLHLPEVVAVAEAHGYTRYWASEHYHHGQSASPILMTALAAGVSDRLRVGMGGVLLRLHWPLQVAADINVLRSFFPGRVDVGIAGAAGDEATARALGGLADDALYRARIEELIQRLRDAATPCAAYTDDAPQFWLCGTSASSARVAGQLGIRYAHHHHLARQRGDDAGVGDAYRDAFRAGPEAEPYFAIACYGSIADSHEQAAEAWRVASGGGDHHTFLGTADDGAAQLLALGDRFGADEIFLDCFAPTLQARLDGLRGLAGALGLDTAADDSDAARDGSPLR